MNPRMHTNRLIETKVVAYLFLKAAVAKSSYEVWPVISVQRTRRELVYIVAIALMIIIKLPFIIPERLKMYGIVTVLTLSMYAQMLNVDAINPPDSKTFCAFSY